MKTKITHLTLDWVFFEATSEEPITYDKALDAQDKLGYMPMGYGIYAFHADGTADGYTAHWKCSRSCD